MNFKGIIGINPALKIHIFHTFQRDLPKNSLCVMFFLLAEANDNIKKVTFGELRRDVALFAAAMRKMGVQIGDRVVGEFHIVLLYLPRQQGIDPSLNLCFHIRPTA